MCVHEVCSKTFIYSPISILSITRVYNTFVSEFFPILETLLMCVLSAIRSLYLQSWQKSVLLWVSSVLGTGKSCRGPSLVNAMAEAYPKK